MTHHHLLVSPSPLYLIGLESVINRCEPQSLIYSSRSFEDAMQKFSSWGVEYIWWAYHLTYQKMISSVILPAVSRNPGVKMILLQQSNSPAEIKEFFNKGISGYLGINGSVEEIVEAFQSCKKNMTYIDPRTSKDLSLLYLESQNEKIFPFEKLTDREKEVLQLIVQGYTTRQIAECLYISKCTVETHRLHLIRKIGVKNTASLVREAMNRQLYATNV